MGGRFGEMSTLDELHVPVVQLPRPPGRAAVLRPIANIAAEEYGHIELVAATINTMLDRRLAGRRRQARRATRSPASRAVGNPHHFLAGGQGALPQDSRGMPWTGDYVFSSGDLVEDLTHNFFLETGARNNKLKVYEMVEHPAARALTGYLLVRGGVHQVAYARALEQLTGADLTKMFPTPRIPTEKIPECQPHIERGDHTQVYRFSPSDYLEIAAVFNGPHPETGEELEVVDHAPEGAPPERPARPARGLRAGLRAGGDRRDRRSGCARRPGCPTSPRGEVGRRRRGRGREGGRQAHAVARWRRGARARVARAEQAVAQGRLVLRARVPLLELGELLERAQAEELEEQRRRAVEDGAERRAAGLLDQPALGSAAVADSSATPRMRAISGRETGCR